MIGQYYIHGQTQERVILSCQTLLHLWLVLHLWLICITFVVGILFMVVITFKGDTYVADTYRRLFITNESDPDTNSPLGSTVPRRSTRPTYLSDILCLVSTPLLMIYLLSWLPAPLTSISEIHGDQVRSLRIHDQQ